MAKSAKELRAEQAEIGLEMQKLHQQREEEGKPFSDEDTEKWNQLLERYDEYEEPIKRADLIEQSRLDAGKTDDEHRQVFEENRKSFSRDPNKPLDATEQSRALATWLTGESESDPRDIELMERAFGQGAGRKRKLDLVLHRGYSPGGAPLQAPRTGDEIERQAKWRAETRAQSVGTATAGGHTVPDEMMRAIDDALLFFGGMRQVSNIVTTSTGADMPIPTADDTGNTGEIIAENTQVNEQDITFGQVVLNSYKYSSKMIRVSAELLQDSATNMVSFIGSKLGERVGRITNTHFTTGTGTGQPNGIVTAAADSGVTAASATTWTWDELLDIVHSVDIAYRTMGARFMMNDTTFLNIKKQKDADGLPIFQPSAQAGDPGQLVGFPFTINNDMANGSSAKSIVFGNLMKYWIREVRGITLLRLDERYADFHQTAFLGFARFDGDLIDAGTNPVKYATQAV